MGDTVDELGRMAETIIFRLRDMCYWFRAHLNQISITDSGNLEMWNTKAPENILQDGLTRVCQGKREEVWPKGAIFQAD